METRDGGFNVVYNPGAAESLEMHEEGEPVGFLLEKQRGFRPGRACAASGQDICLVGGTNY